MMVMVMVVVMPSRMVVMMVMMMVGNDHHLSNLRFGCRLLRTPRVIRLQRCDRVCHRVKKLLIAGRCGIALRG
jgi:hypothetical protein